uniref:Uncharacterized protein n=1 Tax=Arundo donax TaxID=35708 RepID=A0A0A9E9R4_ARUDO
MVVVITLCLQAFLWMDRPQFLYTLFWRCTEFRTWSL